MSSTTTVTRLAVPLTDYAVASSSATFQTPFKRLGILPEGCSTFLFPRIMGEASAKVSAFFRLPLMENEFHLNK